MKKPNATRFVQLTSFYNKKPIYLNIDMVGGIIQDDDHTLIKHLTHNNGGFKVMEDAEEVLDLINELNN
jgi:hypothetical protein